MRHRHGHAVGGSPAAWIGRARIAVAAACLVWAWARPAGAEITGYEALTDWADLPLVKTGVTAGLAGSYDRSGGNADYNQYESPGGQLSTVTPAVIKTLTGPGILTRYWMPHATAGPTAYPIRITVDGQVVIDTISCTFLAGTYGYMTSPLVSTLVGGQTNYEPIAFQHSAVIETTNLGTMRDYYQVGYRLLGAGQSVAPYTGSLSVAQQAARTAAVSVLNNVGVNPNATPGVSLATGGASVPAGGTAVLADITGGGQIQALRVRMAGASDAQLDGLRLRVRYDGQSGYAVDVPVSQFYGVGHGRAAYQSLPLGNDPNAGFYCYWPMPYRRGARVELYNSTGGAIPIDGASVQYDPTWALPLDVGYFHAVYSEETTVAGQGYHQLLNVSGQGHYVGNLLYLQKAGDARTLLEGDDIVTVNPGTGGQSVLYGTGLEDAYNGGYYYNHISIIGGEPASPQSGTGPMAGLLNLNFFDMPGFTQNPVTRADQYRWLLSDAVPYTDGINVKIENFNATAGVVFGSTAFYYDVPVRIAGDADRDGVVSLADFSILKAHYGQAGMGWDEGDFDTDGEVSLADFSLLKAHYSQTAGSLPVPEPVSGLVLGAAGLAAIGRRRRKCR